MDADHPGGLSRVPRRFHIHMPISAILKSKPGKLESLFQNTESGRYLSATEVIELAKHYQVQGYKAIPSCDNHRQGICQGHPALPDGPADC